MTPQDSNPPAQAVCSCGHPVSDHNFFGCLTAECHCRLDEYAALASRVAELEAALRDAEAIINVVRHEDEVNNIHNPSVFAAGKWHNLGEFLQNARRILSGAK